MTAPRRYSDAELRDARKLWRTFSYYEIRNLCGELLQARRALRSIRNVPGLAWLGADAWLEVDSIITRALGSPQRRARKKGSK